MKHLKRPITAFMMLFVLYHIVLIFMRNEHQVFWHLYTGLMLLASVGYIYYERNINSKRLLDSIITGILASFIIVIIHTGLSFIFKDLHFFHVIKQLVKLGVYVKWQLIITLVISIPLQELMFRNLFQNQLDEWMNRYLSALIVSILATSLFMYVVSYEILIFIWMTQFILALSYRHTNRLITPITGQVCAIIILILIHQS